MDVKAANKSKKYERAIKKREAIAVLRVTASQEALVLRNLFKE